MIREYNNSDTALEEVGFSQRCRRIISCRGFGGVPLLKSPNVWGI
jgi:hypothetical protein